MNHDNITSRYLQCRDFICNKQNNVGKKTRKILFVKKERIFPKPQMKNILCTKYIMTTDFKPELTQRIINNKMNKKPLAYFMSNTDFNHFIPNA